MRRNASLAWRLLACAVLSLVVAGAAFSAELQLAGIRLGASEADVMKVFGQPDGIVVGGPAAGAAGGAAGMMPGMGPGMGGGMMPGMMPGMGGGAMPGASGRPPGMTGPGMGSSMMPGMGPGMGSSMMPGGMPGEMGMGSSGMGGPMMGGAMGPGMMRGGPGAGAAAGGAGGFPMWASPVAVELKADEVAWIYSSPIVKSKKMKAPRQLDEGVVLGFVFDDHGFVNCIAIAGRSCSYARTALWKDAKFVKLGDDFRIVMERYGVPDDTKTFDASGVTVAEPMTGTLQVSFTEGSNTFSRDLIVEYTERNNISFTLSDMKVTRIIIWGAQ
jgi:hypothetical protein